MIRLAQERDIQAIADTYRSLLTCEQAHGSASNWKLNVYPTIRVPREKVPAGEMYVLEECGGICASMVMNRDQAQEYEQVPW